MDPARGGPGGTSTAIRDRSEGERPSAVVAAGFGSVAGVTIANGADNISAYTPVFRTIGVGASVITVLVFAVMVAVWCVAGSWLGSHKRVVALLGRYGRWLVPIVYMTIGALVVTRSGVINRLP
jgi:cadmium resistance protein CadD (predicted permease)